MIDAAQFLRLLEAELSTLNTLADALQSERTSLVGRDIPEIEAATAAKAAAAETHHAQQQQRLDWMSTTGLDATRPLAESIDTLHAAGDLDAAAARGAMALQGRLAELATRCQSINRQNGMLILRLQERARGALDRLRGGDTRGDIYSLSGARDPSADSRSLGKA